MSREPSNPGEGDRPQARSNFFQHMGEEEATTGGPEESNWDEGSSEFGTGTFLDDVEDFDGAGDSDDYDASYDDADYEADAAAEPRRNRSRGRSPERATSGAAMLITGLGWLFAISGVVIGALAVGGVAGVSGVLDTVGALGLGPGMFLVTGIVLVVLGSIRTQSHQRARHDELHLGRIERALERLSTREVPTAAPSAPQTDDARIDHALLALERQDEKLANLTRATKMYGKPLIDITKQVAELADQLSELSGATAGFGELAERLA